MLKDKIESNKKNIIKEKQENDEIDHLKRLRYEVQMYNRILADKRQEQEKKQNQKAANWSPNIIKL